MTLFKSFPLLFAALSGAEALNLAATNAHSHATKRNKVDHHQHSENHHASQHAVQRTALAERHSSRTQARMKNPVLNFLLIGIGSGVGLFFLVLLLAMVPNRSSFDGACCTSGRNATYEGCNACDASSAGWCDASPPLCTL